MNLQVDNPVCILNQETAKNFLHSNDAHAKYKLFERATQMDAMRHEFSVAEEELSRSKSCMKEKLQVCFLFLNDYLAMILVKHFLKFVINKCNCIFRA